MCHRSDRDITNDGNVVCVQSLLDQSFNVGPGAPGHGLIVLPDFGDFLVVAEIALVVVFPDLLHWHEAKF